MLVTYQKRSFLMFEKSEAFMAHRLQVKHLHAPVCWLAGQICFNSLNYVFEALGICFHRRHHLHCDLFLTLCIFYGKLCLDNIWKWIWNKHFNRPFFNSCWLFSWLFLTAFQWFLGFEISCSVCYYCYCLQHYLQQQLSPHFRPSFWSKLTTFLPPQLNAANGQWR